VSALPLAAGSAELRTWSPGDLDALVRKADSEAVWRNLTEAFPRPYTRGDGEQWIAQCLEQQPPRDLVISIADELAGACGIALGVGTAQQTAAIGYWLGQEHWGKGVATAALGSFLSYVWDTFPVARLQASVFAWNPASARVLEKNGFSLEGTLRQAVHKDGEITDELIYGLLREDAG
jgi:[ribosomal protein S5]-alanine N-acetyltransferase